MRIIAFVTEVGSIHRILAHLGVRRNSNATVPVSFLLQASVELPIIEAGQRYAEAVADALRALGCTVRVIDVVALGLPPKGDAVDWLAANPDATAADIDALPTIGLPRPRWRTHC